MTDAVKLPKEVAKAVETIWRRMANPDYYIKHICLTNWQSLKDDYPFEYEVIIKFAHDNPIKYMTALFNGYEVEEESEGIVKGMFERAIVLKNIEPHLAYRLGMKDFARAYDIKIRWEETT